MKPYPSMAKSKVKLLGSNVERIMIWLALKTEIILFAWFSQKYLSHTRFELMAGGAFLSTIINRGSVPSAMVLAIHVVNALKLNVILVE